LRCTGSNEKAVIELEKDNTRSEKYCTAVAFFILSLTFIVMTLSRKRTFDRSIPANFSWIRLMQGGYVFQLLDVSGCPLELLERPLPHSERDRL
jgi:hypothetical protein